MPGLDPQVAMHHLNINSNAKPIKQQQQQRLRPEIIEAIESEVKRLMDSSFIKEEQYPDWVVNIVPVPKKNGKFRICIDYRDLNASCLKEEFALSITDVMTDDTCDFERMSFMDGFSGYNQIKMYPEDEKHTFFRTPVGIYCYTVMPFSLQNAGAIYQRVMNTIFHEHMH